ALAITPVRETEYLLASCLHPGFVESMQGFNTALWHLGLAGQSAPLAGDGNGKAELRAAGDSGGLRALCVMHALGFRRFIIHGMDYSFRREAQHACARSGPIERVIPVALGRHKFLTSPARLAHAKTFIRTVAALAEPIELTLRGDGLLLEMCRAVQQKNAA